MQEPRTELHRSRHAAVDGEPRGGDAGVLHGEPRSFPRTRARPGNLPARDGRDAREGTGSASRKRLRPPRRACGCLLIGEQRKIAVLGEGLFSGQLPRRLVCLGQTTGSNLARFDVRLIERIDLQNRARHGGGDLPSEELLRQIPPILTTDAHDGMPALAERVDSRIDGRRFRVGVQSEPHENPIVARYSSGVTSPSPSMGMSPCRSLPVDSASSCSSHPPKLAQRPGSDERHLVMPQQRPCCPEWPRARYRGSRRVEHRRRN